jgi:hypothetical protein
MVNKNQEFFKLLKCSNKLRKKQIFIQRKSEKSKKLSKFLIIIRRKPSVRQKIKYTLN